MEPEAFIEAGLYDPDAADAGQRRELIEHLLRRGYTSDQIIHAGSRVALLSNVAVALARPLPPLLTMSEIAARCDASVDEVAAVRTALGFGVAKADVPDVPDTFVEDFGLYRLACAQYGREPTLAFARVLGGAMMTMMEAARELFTAGLRETAATELQVSEANEVGVAAWDMLRDAVGHLMVERAARDIWFEAGLLKGRLTMAVGFVDLASSTRWTENITSAEHAAALSRFELAAARLAATSGGRVVKFIGDEAMIVADPHAATTIVVDLIAAIAEDPSLPSARGAVTYGPVTARAGDYFGPVVNLASRLTKAAAPNSVDVTTFVAEHLDPTAWSLSNARTVQLRGIEQPIDIVTVEHAIAAS